MGVCGSGIRCFGIGRGEVDGPPPTWSGGRLGSDQLGSLGTAENSPGTGSTSRSNSEYAISIAER